MSKKKTSYRVLRTEDITRGETTYKLVAGEVRDDLPEEITEALSGSYGGLVEVDDDE